MSSSSVPPLPEGPGSVSGAPNLPDGCADAFTTRFVDAGEVRLHAVVGGEGPPLLLVYRDEPAAAGNAIPNAAATSSPVG